MSKVIKLRRGLDINLVGSAEGVLNKSESTTLCALVPDHYRGVTPKLLAKEGDAVLAGTPVFFDKENPEVLFSSPVSGTLSAIVRGDKRKILAIEITPDGKNTSVEFPTQPIGSMSREQVKEQLLQSGLWPTLIQRPFGIIAKSATSPKAIFVSGLDTAPLAPDMSFLVQDEANSLNAGLEVLKKLTDGAVHLTISSSTTAGPLSQVKTATIHQIEGPHPAGNVGVQIAQIDPIGKGDIVWTIDLQHVVMIGRLFATGRVDMTKTIALTGSEVAKPRYYRINSGSTITPLIKGNITPREDCVAVRYISGNPLTGCKIAGNGYIGFYHNQVSCLPEGDHHEFLGWGMPRFNKFSVSRSYFSWLCPNKKYRLDTNINGGERALVQSGMYDKVVPMDIYPIYLLKAIMAGDIDKMEQLGIYEILEEDLALCEFIDPSKTEWQATIAQGINLMIKEL